MKRQLIIRVFYICFDGFSRQRAEQQIYQLMEDYKVNENELPEDINSNYYFQDIWLPTKSESKVEILYPTDNFNKKDLADLDKLKERIKKVNDDVIERMNNILKEKSIPEPPKFPMSRIITEGTYGSCPKCGSTEQYKFMFFGFHFGKKLGCLQPECENYYLKNK